MVKLPWYLFSLVIRLSHDQLWVSFEGTASLARYNSFLSLLIWPEGHRESHCKLHIYLQRSIYNAIFGISTQRRLWEDLRDLRDISEETSLIDLTGDVSAICKSILFEMSVRRCMRRLRDASMPAGYRVLWNAWVTR